MPKPVLHLHGLTLLAAAVARVSGRGGAFAFDLAASIAAAAIVAIAWRRAAGASLRPALVWAGIALILSTASVIAGAGEPPDNGRPAADQWAYLSTLAGLAALLTVLNARTPGGGAWAILMASLVVVFLLPWLEGAWMVRQRDGWDRLRLAVPWNYFFGLLVFVGITNYLPTRFGSAALVAGAGFLLAGLGLTRTDWSNRTRGELWAWVPWCWSAAVLMAEALHEDRGAADSSALRNLWLWYRDHWGTVWALRTRDRFNATASAAGWDFRLDWGGPVPTKGTGKFEVPEEAVATLAGLLRRFADKAVVDAVSRPAKPPSLADRPRADHD